MCGIVGWHGSGSGEGSRVLLDRMLQALVHRGPDEDGRFLEEDYIALGIRRLSIMDVKGGHQPIANEDRSVWVVLNGEIYNFPELRRELEAKGHTFKTRSDTEVIVHGYEEWGDDCVSHLNGIFGFAVWDCRRRRLLLARDHFGVKPLYYYADANRLTFASEIKAILADATIPRKVDLNALDLFLTFRFVPSPSTMFEGVKKLAPGHRLIKDDSGVRVERYFEPSVTMNEGLSERDWIALLQEKLEAAVSRQMMSDVPIGALLSGGIDSGVVVAIMSKLTNHAVRTFTVGFTDGDDVNELKEARATAALFGTEHNEIVLSSLDYEQMLNMATWHLDEPIATTSALAMYSVCRLAREHVTVVLTGQGADEPFSGYPRYFGERYGELYRHIAAPLRDGLIRPIIESLPRNERLKRAVRSLGTNSVTERFAQVYAVFTNDAKAAMWQPDVAHSNGSAVGALIDYWRKGIEHLDPLMQMAYVDARLSLSDDLLTYGDKMSMAASIEARVPFLDLEYMKVAESLPPQLRIRGTTLKYIHKQVVAKWLPQEIIDRPKRGFDTPVDRWFRSELSGYVRDVLLSPDSACCTYFKPQAISKLLNDHLSGRQDNRRHLFLLLVFELWHRQFISRSTEASAAVYTAGNFDIHQRSAV